MGAWGITAFQSDAGLDFLCNITENNGVKDSIDKALGGVICISSYCSEVEALAEIIANSYGKIECDDKCNADSDNADPELLKAMKSVRNLETDKKYFENTLVKLHYALNIINQLDIVLWKDDSLEQRKQYISKLSKAIEEVINDVKAEQRENI